MSDLSKVRQFLPNVETPQFKQLLWIASICCINTAIWVGISQTAHAQFPNNAAGGLPDQTLIEPPRELERLLDEAQEHIQNQVWSEATLAAGILLGLEEAEIDSEGVGQDYFLDAQINSGHTSMREEALSLLDSMPDAGQKVIELRYGVQARQTLDEAITNHTWSGVQEVSRKYPFTLAGREAQWLLAEEKLGRGLPLDAAIVLQDLLRHTQSMQQFGANGLLFLATCWIASGNERQAVEVLDRIKMTFPKAKLDWKGKPVDLGLDAVAISQEIAGSIAIKPTSFKTTEPGWVGGDLERNADSMVGLPVPLTNWKYWMHESVQHEESAYKTIKQKLTDRNSILVPSRVPIVAYPWVIVMSYGQRVNAIHLKTGKMVWGSSFNSIPYELSMDRFTLREGPSTGIVAQDYLMRRIWGESSVGQLSSDGKNLYCLAELASVDAAESLALGIHANVARPIARRNYNCLQALSIAEQGKLVWEVGGENGIAEPALAGVLFLGTPIAHNEELLAMGELNGEIFLFAIDPLDGHLRWKQQLVANTAGPLASDPKRRNQSCVPSIAGGLCICPTLSGQLIAVNLNSRSLVWSLPYSQNANFQSARFNAFGNPSMNDLNPMELRSSDAGVLITGDCVIHAPSDGETVYAVDLLDGKLRWELSKNSIIYVAGGWDDRVLLVGDQLLYCVDAKTGKSVWENSTIPLSSSGRVVGRGCRNGQHFYVPMSSQEILDVDLDTGKIVDRMRVALPLGNLIATADQIISLSPVELTAYSIRDRVRAEVDLDFAAGNISSTVLQRKSKIHLAEGDIESAIDAAEKAYQMDRKDPEVQHLLRYIALRALQDNFEKYASRVVEYEDLISNGPERTQYLISVIDGLVRRGESVTVTQKLLELQGDIFQRRFASPSLGETIDPETNLTVQNDIWTAAKLAQLYESSGEKERSGMVELISERILALSKLDANADAEPRSDMFRWLPMSASLRLAVAESALQSGDSLLAEQLLEEIMQVNNLPAKMTDATSKEKSADLLLKINKLRLSIYDQVGRWTTSVALARDIGEKLTELKVEPVANSNSMPMMRRSRVSLNSTTPADLSRLAGGIAEWPKGQVKVESRIVDRPLQSIIGSSPCPLKQIVGSSLLGWTVYLQQGAIELVGPTGTQRLTIPTEIMPRGMGPTGTIAHVLDSIVLLELPTEVIAIDTLRAAMLSNDVANSSGDCILWRESFASQSIEEVTRNGGGSKLLSERTAWGSDRVKNRRGFAVGPVSRFGIVVTQSGNLISLDPRTGTRRWVRSGLGPQLTVAQEGPRLIVIDSLKSNRLVIDARDGKLLDSFPMEEKWEVWTSAGKNFLTAKIDKSSKNPIEFKLLDGLTGKAVIDKSFPEDTRAEIISGSGDNPPCLVAWQNNQPLTFWNLLSGGEHTYDVPLKTTMRSINLERSGDKILILPETMTLKVNFVKPEEADRFRKVSGPVLAIDPINGKPAWEKPVIVHDFRFPIAQIRNTPAIVLTRNLSFKANGLIPTETASVAIMDNRDGKLLYNDNYLISSRGGADFQCMTRLGANEVTLQYRGAEVQATWSDNPVSEELAKEQNTSDVGKIDLKSIQSGVPPKLLERLQSGEGPGEPTGQNADYDQLFK